MQLQFHCLANCLTKTLLRVLDIHKVPPARQFEIMLEHNDMICEQPPDDCHVCIAMSEMYLMLRRRLGIYDPLQDMKREQNAQALDLFPLAESLVARQKDPLLGALKMSCVGNMIDFAFGNDFDVEPALRSYMDQDFAVSNYRDFQEALPMADTIVMICDNAGEIVFDKLLLNEIINWRKSHGFASARMSVIVKGAPVLNDAMRADAEYAGLHELADIYDTGCEYIGVFVKYVSQDALKVLRDADLVISKGLANYESLSLEEEFARKIYFLFKAKCKPSAQRINVPQQSIIFARGTRFVQS